MEDIIIVVWIVMIAVGSLINSANKRRAKQTPQSEEQESPQRPVVIRVPAPTTMSQEGQSIESESLETIDAPFTTASKRPKRIPRAKLPAQAKPKKPIITAAKTTKKADTIAATYEEPNRDLTRDFDLERAVVYSEILKPKYQEYE